MKKLISLLLVFSSLLLLMPLTAKERKGADLIVQRTDGTQVRGELIAVKQSSLLLLERESGGDVTVDIDDIRVVKIVKKSQLLLGAGLGTLIGGISGVIIGTAERRKTLEESEETPLYPFSRVLTKDLSLIIGVIGGILGSLIGGIIGAAAGKDETIRLEGKSDSEIQEILEKLRKKARVKNAQ